MSHSSSFHHVEGIIETVKCHQKVYKIRVGNANEKQEIMIFRTELTGIINRFVQSMMKDLERDKEKEKEKAKEETNTPPKDDSTRVLLKQIPIFVVGNRISAYCSYYKDMLCIKQFSVSSPQLSCVADSSQLKHVKSWTKSMDKWLLDLVFKFTKDKLNVLDSSKIADARRQLTALNTMTALTALTVMNAMNSTSSSHTNKDKDNDKNMDCLEYLSAVTNVTNTTSNFNLFLFMRQFYEKFNIFAQMKSDIIDKTNNVEVSNPFTDADLIKLIDFCDDYPSFCSDPFSSYLSQHKHQYNFPLLEKFAAIQDVELLKRLEGNVVYNLQNVMNCDGHTCFPLKKLVQIVDQQFQRYLLTKEQKRDYGQIDLEAFIEGNKNFHVYEGEGEGEERERERVVYLKYVWNRESFIVQRLSEYVKGKEESEGDDEKREIREYIKQFQEETSTTLHQKQVAAIFNTLSTIKGINILTGLPGSGKSHVISCIRYICERLLAGKSKKILMCAPTGKAANRLSGGSSGGLGGGLTSSGKENNSTASTASTASTIHRLLEATYNETTKTFTFMRNETNMLDADILVIDETSMMDLTMMYNVLKACPLKLSILFVGDQHQLPSVGFGDILNSLIDSKCIPMVSLSKVYRQGEGSTISLLSKYVIRGIVPSMNVLNDGKETIYKAFSQGHQNKIIDEAVRLYQKYGNDSIILTPMRKGNLGSMAINQQVHNVLIERGTLSRLYGNDGFYCKDERIIVANNTYAKDKDGQLDMIQSAFNGDMGFFNYGVIDEDGNGRVNVSIEYFGLPGLTGGLTGPAEKNPSKRYRMVSLERDTIELGHACTIHKMQGAEIPVVILIINGYHSKMLNKRLFYTAITRAKKKLYILGDENAIVQAISAESPERHEYMGRRIREDV